MVYITSDNKIMARTCDPELIEISNNTSYLPLTIYCNIVLMSHGKLCAIRYYNNLNNLTLLNLELETGKDYVVNSNDFTEKFVKINSKYYKINGTVLQKIPILAKNSRNIVSAHRLSSYYYVDTNNKLSLFNENDNSIVILDHNVSTLLYNEYRIEGKNNIICEKNNIIICLKYDKSSLLSTHTIDYNGSSIIKTLDWYMLDSDGHLYEFLLENNNSVITKILDNVIDFNYCDQDLFILDTEHKLFRVNIEDYNLTHIDDDSYFKKRVNVTKSSNNVYKQ